MVKLTASQITQDALLILRAKGARVRRVNNVGAFKKRSNQVEPGWPDIQGYSFKGVALLVEIKTVNDKISYDQKERLLDCDKCGGIALVAIQENSSTKLLNINEYLKK